MQLVAYGSMDILIDRSFGRIRRTNAYNLFGHEYYQELFERRTKKNEKRQHVINHKTTYPGTVRQLKKGTTCVISYDEIQQNDTYAICNNCDKIFSWGHILLWLQKNETCPHCRQNMFISCLKKYVNTTKRRNK